MLEFYKAIEEPDVGAALSAGAARLVAAEGERLAAMEAAARMIGASREAPTRLAALEAAARSIEASRGVPTHRVTTHASRAPGDD